MTRALALAFLVCMAAAPCLGFGIAWDATAGSDPALRVLASIVAGWASLVVVAGVGRAFYGDAR